MLSCKLEGMIDIDLFVKALRSKGHSVEHVHGIPENAGEYEFTIDGKLVTLEEARNLLEADEPK